MTDEDRLWRDLRALPERPPDELAAARIHHRARAAFAAATRPGTLWLHRLDRAYGRLEPLLAVGVCAAFLTWAIGVIAAVR